ncbi:MAG TPA: diguanylate cyclase [Solirubrobacteraceae bacterium]|nr:diguanylate cyclase [Solirubrobacteraceae bacterium]
MTSVPTSLRAVGAVLCTVAVVVATLLATSSIEHRAADRGYAGTQSAQVLLNTMLDRETGLRGFLETNDEAFLSPYVGGSARFAAAAKNAESYARAVPTAQQALGEQQALAARWQVVAEAVIAQVRRQGVHHLSLQDALTRKQVMDSFRAANGRYLAAMNAQRVHLLSVATTLSTWIIVGLSLLLTLTGLWLVRVNSRRERRAAEALRAVEQRRDARERAYVEDRRRFAEVVQVSETESEARELIKRRIEAGLPGAMVTVLSRNNSADRLEATTSVPQESPLAQALEGAKPRSCLAIRMGHEHEEQGPQEASAVACELCGKIGGRATCEPLLVSGEVIGSLLIAHEDPLDEQGRRLINETVIYTAPVLANLRNLAIAERRAHTDSLTGLPNRRALDDTFKLLIAQAGRSLAPLSVMLIDLDRFKNVNDTYGHDRGDEVLAAVSTSLRESVRSSDFVARMGGEEFLVLLPNTDPLTASVVAEGMAKALAKTRVHGLEQMVTASFGVAGYPMHGVDMPNLLRSADRALYQAKRDGRDCVRMASAASGREEDLAPVSVGAGESL